MNIELEEFQKLILERERLRTALWSLCNEVDNFLIEYDSFKEKSDGDDLPWIRNNCTQEAKRLLEKIK